MLFVKWYKNNFSLQIEESENLPQLICDLCIIQLNVAYNFKRQAIATDTKMRQYIIENGFELTKNSTSHHVNNLHDDSRMKVISTPSISDYQHRPDFPVMPLIIKTEPFDYDILSDITIDTNTEAYTGGGSNENSLSNVTPFAQYNQMSNVPQSMVRLNNIHLLSTANADSDNEFINNYLPIQTLNRDSPSVSLDSSYSPKVSTSELGLIVANAKISKTTDSGNASAASSKSEDRFVPPTRSKSEVSSEAPKVLKLRSHDVPNTAIGRRNGNKERPNYSETVKRKRLINPANHLQKKIKLEKLSQSLPVVRVGRGSKHSKQDVKLTTGRRTSSTTAKSTKNKTNETIDHKKNAANRKRVTISSSDLFSLPDSVSRRVTALTARD